MAMTTKYYKIAKTERALLIQALRHANKVSDVLNKISIATFAMGEGRLTPAQAAHRIHTVLLRRYRDASGLPLFIAADNLKIALPKDLRDDMDAGLKG